MINEYGQVIVPSSYGNNNRMIVGVIEGCILFENPFDGEAIIDISDFCALKCGDPWNYPYVGIPYNLSNRNEIYFNRSHEDGRFCEYPPEQDMELISKLRAVRRTGPVRFIVNPYGIVLTKRPPEDVWMPDERWEPVFVGLINRKYWFKKEG